MIRPSPIRAVHDPAAVARIRPAIALFLSRIPTVDERSILREIVEMERQGQPVLIVPLFGSRSSPEREHLKDSFRMLQSPSLFSLRIWRPNVLELWRDPSGWFRRAIRFAVASLAKPSMSGRSFVLFFRSAWLAERLEAEGIRHIHAHFADHPTTAAWLIASIRPITYSFTVYAHDIFSRRFLLKEKVASASFIRAVSTFNEAYLEGLYPGPCEGKIQVIHAGIQSEDLAPSPERTARARILCVAALKRSKGLGLLVEACAELESEGVDFECLIVGDGPLHGAVEGLIRQKRLTERVRLLGRLPPSEVEKLMRQSTLFVLPSVIAPDGEMDGLPIALIEAAAAGCPIVASAISGIPELVESGVDGLLVDPGNSEQLARAMRSLIEHPIRARSMARRARRKIVSEFDLRTSVQDVLERLDELHDPPTELEELLFSLPELTAASIGVRGVHRGKDSTVAELLVSDGNESFGRVLKQQRDRPGQSRPPGDRAEKEYALMNELPSVLSRASGQGRQLSIPRLFHLDRERAMLLMEPARGVRLDELIREGRDDSRGRESLTTALADTGRWLAAFQQQEVKRKEPDEVVARLLRRALHDLELACASERALRAKRGQIQNRLKTWAAHATRQRVAPAHGDFWPGNVFVSAERIEVIDFEGAHDGLPWEDVAYFLVQLSLFLVLPTRRHLRAPFARAFLEGYGSSGTSDPTLAFCRMAKSLQILCSGLAPREGPFHLLRRRALRTAILGMIR